MEACRPELTAETSPSGDEARLGLAHSVRLGWVVVCLLVDLQELVLHDSGTDVVARSEVPGDRPVVTPDVPVGDQDRLALDPPDGQVVECEARRGESQVA